ncbi:MAG TPA: trehalose-phosphatase [Acetobacteraceae bacterium]
MALLLDLDGTLLDIAPRPEAVVVPAGLTDALRRIRKLLEDALAVITGRPVETVDSLLGEVAYAVAGEHGGAIRHKPGAAVLRPPLPSPAPEWIAAAERLAAAHPGVLFEPKARGFALHYRAAPALARMLRDALERMLAGSSEFELLPAHMLWEVRPRGIDKGKAVTRLMGAPPFLGRLPVFIGDDVTDEDGIAAAAGMGGAGLRVQEAFGDAAGVRAWLAAIAERGDWP